MKQQITEGNTALILFGHGARDVRWREPFVKVQQKIQNTAPRLRVELAFLEHMRPNLLEAVTLLSQNHYQNINIIPLFIGQGGHVRNDLVELLNQCQKSFPDIFFRTAPALGESEAILHAIAEYCVDHCTPLAPQP